MDTFNPHKIHLGVFIPNWLLCRSEVSGGAKLCYATLARYSSPIGECSPEPAMLAEAIGATAEQLVKALAILEEQGLIKCQPCHPWPCYEFLWHPWMDADPLVERLQKKEKVREVLRYEIPLIFNTPQFVVAWEAYVKYRREKKKGLTNEGARLNLEKLLKMGHDRAVQSLEASIANGWQGLFEPPLQNGARNGHTSVAPVWKQIQQIEHAIETHPGNPRWIGFDSQRATPAIRDDLKCLRAKLAKMQQEQVAAL